ncbi:MAG: EAL domain-containing protein [Coriobacteriales bacterium]|nr:EAL domain-containing protein [Coriobacteriales bacterium]
MSQSLDQYIRESFSTALHAGHIQVYYQPVVRSISRKLCSFEALARWVDPDRGLITPNYFIPVLEEMRAIHLLDIDIIRQACAQIRRTVDAGQTPIPVSVNLSRLDFALCDIFSAITHLVSMYQIPRDFLYIEITESLMAEQGSNMHEVINKFRSAGFQIWMDDFGSGYSSLNLLKDFSFDEIKMDMHFLTSFDQRSRRIMASVIQMAKEINIHTLAEGVETEEQFQYLRDIGCEKLQGFYFGRPMPYAEALAHLAQTGVEIEKPLERAYCDSIGMVNFLSAVPFMPQEKKDSLTNARQLNSIPLALAEACEDSFSVLFYNAAFEETAKSTGMISNIFSQEMLCKPRPYNLLPSSIISLMDSTRSGAEGHMYFVSHEEYYEIQAKCVAQKSDAYCVLFRMSNLSKQSDSQRQEKLDEGLRQIYTLYDRIALIDVENDSILPLYFASRDDLVSGRSGLSKLSHEFAERWIFAEDREAWLKFIMEATLGQGLVATGRTSATKAFRTHVGHGRYEWKSYTLLYLQSGMYVELVRNVHQEVAGIADRLRGDAQWLQSSSQEEQDSAQGVQEERVWRAIVDSGLIRLFWKDRERRFRGASRSFLDYYGFESTDDILGKTDEDLGWHVRPSAYMTDELSVIREGIVTQHEPGHCIRNGENRDIFASKAPVYDRRGEIAGLVGYFIDSEMLLANDSRGEETKRRDMLTGLLNSRGLHEEARLFRDAYFLRHDDFVRIEVGLDDINAINAQFGFDFGDKAIAELGRALKNSFGRQSAVGRVSGQQFAILCQVDGVGEVHELLKKTKEIAGRIRQIDGIAITLYVSVGACLFSETENIGEQAKRAEVRLLADQDEHTTTSSRKTRSAEIFHLYDNLPIAYAVYKVVKDDASGECDARIFYVNHAFEARCGTNASELLGKSVREEFPTMDEQWYDWAQRAAFNGEIIVEKLCYVPLQTTYSITVSQVIHSGYCCFTYQEID